MDESISANSNQVSYPRWVVVGVFVLVFAIAGLSAWQLKNRFVISFPQLGSGEALQSVASSLLEAQDDQLKKQDSDLDGLNDYEETKVYGTSPFIADTDSDRLTDAAEVRAGTDPTCPTGQTCRSGDQSLANTQANQNPFLSADFKAVLEDPKQLRQLLIQGGADPQVINQLDDQTVQLLAQEAFKSATEPTQEKVDILKQVNAEQIRALLKSSGLSEEQIATFTDEQLLQIYNEALSQAETEIQKQPNQP